MTIRMLTSQLELTITRRQGAPHVVRLNGARLVECDTREEAEQAKRAFETVLAPRFTRDEAIAFVKSAAYAQAESHWLARGTVEGIRLALEALAAAGVFVDGRDMAGKLDAAGIR